MAPSVEEQAFTCWLRGVGVKQAQVSIRNVCGEEVATAVIQAHFAKFAREWMA